MSCVPGADSGSPPGLPAEVRAQPRNRAQVALRARPRRSRRRTARPARAARPAATCSAACAGATCSSSPSAGVAPRRAHDRAAARPASTPPVVQREAAVLADRRPAARRGQRSTCAGHGVVHLVRDDRARDGLELVERRAARPRSRAPLLRQHAPPRARTGPGRAADRRAPSPAATPACRRPGRPRPR